MPAEKRSDLMTAALFYDIGALDLDVRIELLEFQEANPYRHTISGHILEYASLHHGRLNRRGYLFKKNISILRKRPGASGSFIVRLYKMVSGTI